MILFDNHRSVGLVIKVHPDSLYVLNAANNHTQTVKKNFVSKKIDSGTRGVNGKYMRKAPTVVDRYHNAIGMRTLVKPLEKGPFKDCIGEVRAIF